ncbi:hypothetical protein NP233_g5279 [Leucocoprinus birnbaumii]|uniref:Uncharacterized protein n=1 Tax=Leucocoprinus birnbaumii TaxID=56174 RepID=A0AAD5VZI6_9AGAR|nr:hypothetical protein NP233_g5279 [Leucocoprinus birnbaumii]
MSSATPTRVAGGIPATADKMVASAFTGALAFGIYLCTLAFTVRWLLFSDEGWSRRKVVNWQIVFVTTFIFVSTLAYSALDLKNVMDQVRLLMIDPSSEYVEPMWLNICKCMFANSIALSADLVLIYRCYALYGDSLAVIAFPSLLWMSGVVCTGLQTYLQIAHMHNSNLGPYIWAKVNMSNGPGIVLIPFWGSTTVLNVYCTFMLLRRIRRAAQESGPTLSGKQFRFVARSIAESGFIYMSISLAHFIVWFTYDSLAIKTIGVLNVPLIGIAFNLILIRAAHRRMQGFEDKLGIGGIGSIELRNGDAALAVLDIRAEPKQSSEGEGGSSTITKPTVSCMRFIRVIMHQV